MKIYSDKMDDDITIMNEVNKEDKERERERERVRKKSKLYFF